MRDYPRANIHYGCCLGGMCVHLCNTRLHQYVITEADDSMSLFTFILKDIAELTISKNSTVPKCFNKS